MLNETKTQDGPKGCVKPFLKMGGGKSQLLNELEKRILIILKNLKELKDILSHLLVEVHFFYLMSNYTVENAYINDVNKELMLVYNVIKKTQKI